MIQHTRSREAEAIAALQAREAERCAALMRGDADALDAMLAEDLVHIHLNGKADGKAAYLAGVREAYTFRALSRGALTIRCYGDVAVMTGQLSQKLEVRATGAVMDVRAMTTQTWLHRDGAWLLTTCHNAPLAA